MRSFDVRQLDTVWNSNSLSFRGDPALVYNQISSRVNHWPAGLDCETVKGSLDSDRFVVEWTGFSILCGDACWCLLGNLKGVPLYVEILTGGTRILEKANTTDATVH